MNEGTLPKWVKEFASCTHWVKIGAMPKWETTLTECLEIGTNISLYPSTCYFFKSALYFRKFELYSYYLNYHFKISNTFNKQN